MRKDIVVAYEVWARIKGWEGYEVSHWGRVRTWRHKTGRRKNPHYMKPSNRSGYLAVCLYKWRERPYRTAQIHTLVLEAFVGHAPKGLICGHRDDVPHNNHLYNLRWVTYRQNALDAIRHGRVLNGERHHNSGLSNEEVLFIRNVLGPRLKNNELIGRLYNIAGTAIRDIMIGKTWKHLK